MAGCCWSVHKSAYRSSYIAYLLRRGIAGDGVVFWLVGELFVITNDLSTLLAHSAGSFWVASIVLQSMYQVILELNIYRKQSLYVHKVGWGCGHTPSTNLTNETTLGLYILFWNCSRGTSNFAKVKNVTSKNVIIVTFIVYFWLYWWNGLQRQLTTKAYFALTWFALTCLLSVIVKNLSLHDSKNLDSLLNQIV